MNAVIGLEDGTILKGTGFGAEGVSKGELVFTTQYTGYEEALTDPSYKGQILMFTYPLIGNYGVSNTNFQSDGIKVEGLVVREACKSPLNDLKTIDKFLKDEGIPGIEGIDTRMLTIKIREQGIIRAAFINGSDDGEKAVQIAKNIPRISDIDLISQVTCKSPYQVKNQRFFPTHIHSECAIKSKQSNNNPHVVIIDLGIKKNILKSFIKRGFDITVLPANTSASMIEAYNPDMLFLSNGPGDPIRAKNAIKAVQEFTGKIPITGICLGHQVISLALGGSTYKLKFGHRGANHPIKSLESNKIYITSQNHGFCVDENSLDGTDLKITHINLNDNTIAGISCKNLNIFGVQYHPEANPGPLDSEKIFFDSIKKMIEEGV